MKSRNFPTHFFEKVTSRGYCGCCLGLGRTDTNNVYSEQILNMRKPTGLPMVLSSSSTHELLTKHGNSS